MVNQQRIRGASLRRLYTDLPIRPFIEIELKLHVSALQRVIDRRKCFLHVTDQWPSVKGNESIAAKYSPLSANMDNPLSREKRREKIEEKREEREEKSSKTVDPRTFYIWVYIYACMPRACMSCSRKSALHSFIYFVCGFRFVYLNLKSMYA